MKTARQWQDEAPRCGPADQLNKSQEMWFIEAIQRDAYENPPTYGELLGLPATFPDEFDDKKNCEILKSQLQIKTAELAAMRNRWLDARKHLRAANKGAERNAIALQLAASRINNTSDPLEGRVWQWMNYSDSYFRLLMGELTSQEIRNIRACLRAILGTSKP